MNKFNSLLFVFTVIVATALGTQVKKDDPLLSQIDAKELRLIQHRPLDFQTDVATTLLRIKQRAELGSLLQMRPHWVSDCGLRATLERDNLDTSRNFVLYICDSAGKNLASIRLYTPLERVDPQWTDASFLIPWNCLLNGKVDLTWQLMEQSAERVEGSPLSEKYKFYIPLDLKHTLSDILTPVDTFTDELRNKTSITLLQNSNSCFALIDWPESVIPNDVTFAAHLLLFMDDKLIGRSRFRCDERCRRPPTDLNVIVQVELDNVELRNERLNVVISSDQCGALIDTPNLKYWHGGFVVRATLQRVK